jgi:hypothetical protein
VVYLAESDSGEQVAIKLLHGHADSSAMSRFLREVAAARKVAPFCTARILDVSEDEDTLFVVTEFIDGLSLREVVEQEGPLTGTPLFRLAIGMATALTAIHGAGVVHRDLKPGNVLLGPDGPRVIDFGIARSIDGTMSATSSVLGTPSYMAPEQLAGEAVGPAADVFAWGATIAYAATGKAPYGQDTIPAVMTRIMTGQPDLGGLTGALRDLVAQCLAKEPGRRPSSQEILLRILEDSGEPISAPEALAQGRAVAAADEAALADARTARWTTIRMPALAVGGHRELGHLLRRPKVLIGGAAAAALVLTACAAAAVVLRPAQAERRGGAEASVTGQTLGQGTSASAPASSPTPDATAPAEVAEAVRQAISARKTASIDVEGSMDQGSYELRATGRFFYQPGVSTSYDVTVYNASEQNDPEALAGRSSRVVLVGNTAYPQEAGAMPIPADAGSYGDDPRVQLAMETRWITSPYNLAALLNNASSLKRSEDEAMYTFQGTTEGSPLSADGAVGAFYKLYGGSRLTVKFTLVVTRDHLPQRLDLNLLIKVDASTTLHSLYSVKYQDWGRSGTISKPY